MLTKKQQILQLRSEGKSYNEIREITGASKGTIAYHCSDVVKQNYMKRTRKYRKTLVSNVVKRLDFFKREKRKATPKSSKRLASMTKTVKNKLVNYLGDKTKWVTKLDGYTAAEIAEYIKKYPICYITGRRFDYKKRDSFHFDHIVARSRGGENDFSNLGIATKVGNQMKGDRSMEELIYLCSDVLNHHGFEVYLDGNQVLHTSRYPKLAKQADAHDP